MPSARRVGLVVPSSNTTMETEVPEMLRRHAAEHGTAFTFHSSRMRMRHVSPEELARMNTESERCLDELLDADCDVIAYACLVAVMAEGPRHHEELESRLQQSADSTPVLTSAGALVRGLRRLGASRVAMVTPYVRSLTDIVCAYVEDAGVEVADALSLEVADNLAVGRLDPAGLPELAARLDLSGCDALVLSACVQMPSLPAVPVVEAATGLPVLTAATATTYEVLTALGLPPHVPDAGRLLDGSLVEASA